MFTRLPQPIFRTIASILLIGASVVPQPTFSADRPNVNLPPVKYQSQYGDLKFPEKYPDGTTLEITLQSHFVPKYDEWFDGYAQAWGKAHNVTVTTIHMNLANLGKALASAIETKQGSTMYEMIVPPSLFIESLHPLNDVNEAAQKAFGEPAQTCARSTYLPSKKLWHGFCQGYVLNPMLYRISWWKDAGYPKGPSTFSDLLKGGKKIIKKDKEHRVGVGMSPEIDSEGYALSLIWSYGGTLQDADGKPALDSPQTVKAVAYAKSLYESAELPEVIDAKGWTAA